MNLSGTPLDLTPFGGLVAALGWLYWLLALGAVVLTWRVAKRWPRKVVLTGIVAVIFAMPAIQSVQRSMEAKGRLERATAHFEMRCKSAGEFIKRKVENVDGVVWMKWRDPRHVDDDFDQFKLFDPFGRDCEGVECIEQLLRLEPQAGRFAEELERRRGRYQFVEFANPYDKHVYRYAGTMKLAPSWTAEGVAAYKRDQGRDPPDSSYLFTTQRVQVERQSARYGLTWDDISTREDREHWIAGGRLQVIDLQNNEVIAERVGYMMDRGLGSRAGFRSPWGYALRNACPAFPSDGTHSTRRWPQTDTVAFATRVLKPREAK